MDFRQWRISGWRNLGNPKNQAITTAVSQSLKILISGYFYLLAFMKNYLYDTNNIFLVVDYFLMRKARHDFTRNGMVYLFSNISYLFLCCMKQLAQSFRNNVKTQESCYVFISPWRYSLDYAKLKKENLLFHYQL